MFDYLQLRDIMISLFGNTGNTPIWSALQSEVNHAKEMFCRRYLRIVQSRSDIDNPVCH